MTVDFVPSIFLITEIVTRLVAGPAVRKTKAVVTAEEHLMNGGLGDSITQVLARNFPAPVEYVALDDKFGESGTPDQLLEKYGLDTKNIVVAVKKVIKRKQLTF